MSGSRKTAFPPRYSSNGVPILLVGTQEGFAIALYDLLGILKLLWDLFMGYYSLIFFLFKSDAFIYFPIINLISGIRRY